jgi:glycosyltransferase involved in cell wall biosynthesis
MTSPTDATVPSIDILLATYNGAAYLEEQLASIEAQTHPNWRLIARDDGSSDRTPDILAAFRTRHPEKVTIVRDADGNLGLVQNFSRLMDASTAPYAAFCDQDDVWLPEKLSLCLERMRDLEAEYGVDKPLLVFTDLTVVDEDLKVIHPSLWGYQWIEPEKGKAFRRLLVMNVVTGCASLMNMHLVKTAAPIPIGARVHDWWIALVAGGLGVLVSDSKRTTLYRQHRNQSIGAKGLPGYVIEVLAMWDRTRSNTAALFTQAAALRDRFNSALSVENQRTLDHFLIIRSRSIDQRFRHAIRAGCLPRSPLRSLKFLLTS